MKFFFLHFLASIIAGWQAAFAPLSIKKGERFYVGKLQTPIDASILGPKRKRNKTNLNLRVNLKNVNIVRNNYFFLSMVYVHTT